MTEAGPAFQGTIKSATAFGILLAEGIGDTIRVSLSAPPVEEVKVGLQLLQSLGLREKKLEIVSCPSCGRAQVDVYTLAEDVTEGLKDVQFPLRVAVMGCVVNGPGEAREADLGVASGNGKGQIFVKGEVIQARCPRQTSSRRSSRRPDASPMSRGSRVARPQSSRRESSPDTAAELTSRPHPAQRRTLAVLSLAQIFVGLANGLAVGVGSLFVVRVTGVDALGGMAATLVTLGGAVMSAPLARLAARRGRRISLTTACVVALTATAVLVISGAFDLGWLVMIGFFGLGASSSLTLQARFAAVDLAQPHRRGRDMSLVIWMTTIGVVAGPSIVPLGDRLGVPLGLGELTGAYVLSGTGLLIVTFVVWVFLRPDPLQAAGAQAGESTANPETAFRILHHPRILWVVVMIASAHAMMVGIMAMTPVHLEHAGQALPLIMLAMSAHTGGMYVLSPVFGFLADSVWPAFHGAARSLPPRSVGGCEPAAAREPRHRRPRVAGIRLVCGHCRRIRSSERRDAAARKTRGPRAQRHDHGIRRRWGRSTRRRRGRHDRLRFAQLDHAHRSRAHRDRCHARPEEPDSLSLSPDGTQGLYCLRP